MNADAQPLGRRRLDLLARDRIPPDVLERHERALAERQAFRDLEYQMFGREGARWIRTSGVPRFDASGRFLGYRGSARDVSELISVRQRPREAVEAIPGDFLLFDADDRLAYKSNSPGRLPHGACTRLRGPIRSASAAAPPSPAGGSGS